MRSVLAASLALALVVGGLAAGTGGFRAFTTESARRLAVARSPRPLPDVLLEDQRGRRFRLNDLRGHPVLVEFIYTRCTSYCVALGTAFQRMKRTLAREGSPVRLLSISFDPRHDDLARLREYAGRYGARAPRWRVARPVDPGRLPTLLQAFGVKVIGDGLGGFTHNAAIMLVDRDGRLSHIYDWDAPDAAVRGARGLLHGGGSA